MVSKRGFSLVELIVSLAIMAIIATVAIGPYLSQFITSTHLYVGTRQLLSDIQTMRDSAMNERKAYKCIFAPGTGSYDIYEADTSANIWLLYKTSTFPTNSLSVSGTSLGSHQLIFDELGSPYNFSLGDPPSASLDVPLVSNGIVTVQDVSGGSKGVIVSPETVYIYIGP